MNPDWPLNCTLFISKQHLNTHCFFFERNSLKLLRTVAKLTICATTATAFARLVQLFRSLLVQVQSLRLLCGYIYVYIYLPLCCPPYKASIVMESSIITDSWSPLSWRIAAITSKSLNMQITQRIPLPLQLYQSKIVCLSFLRSAMATKNWTTRISWSNCID